MLATQNPLEMEGTYPLPEAQLDRFFFKLHVDRSRPATSCTRSSTARPASEAPAVRPVLDRERLLEMRALVREVPVARHVQDYAVRAAPGDAPARATARRR